MRTPFDHFDLIARWYDRLLPRPDDDNVIALLGIAPGWRVLDVGGGTGRVTERLQRFGADVVVCDLSQRMAEQAAQKGLMALRSDVAHLPFVDGAADAIVVVDAFHHFNRPDAARGQRSAAFELARVLAPGGRLLIEDPDIRQLAVKGVAFGETLMLMHSRFLPPDALIALFGEAGLRLQQAAPSRFSTQLVFVHR